MVDIAQLERDVQQQFQDLCHFTTTSLMRQVAEMCDSQKLNASAQEFCMGLEARLTGVETQVRDLRRQFAEVVRESKGGESLELKDVLDAMKQTHISTLTQLEELQRQQANFMTWPVFHKYFSQVKEQVRELTRMVLFSHEDSARDTSQHRTFVQAKPLRSLLAYCQEAQVRLQQSSRVQVPRKAARSKG